MLQGSTTADVEIYGVLDEHDSLGLAGDGSPGFDPADPDFHFANSGLFHYYDHEDALFPLNDPSIIDDDDVVNTDNRIIAFLLLQIIAPFAERF